MTDPIASEKLAATAPQGAEATAQLVYIKCKVTLFVLRQWSKLMSQAITEAEEVRSRSEEEAKRKQEVVISPSDSEEEDKEICKSSKDKPTYGAKRIAEKESSKKEKKQKKKKKAKRKADQGALEWAADILS